MDQQTVCGVEDFAVSASGALRLSNALAPSSPGFGSTAISYHVDLAGMPKPVEDHELAVLRALDAWATALPALAFTAASTPSTADFTVTASTPAVDAGLKAPGLGQVGAYSSAGGNLVFNANAARGPVKTYAIALHELGHILGVSHNDRVGSVMFPVLQNPPALALDPASVDVARGLYPSDTAIKQWNDRASNGTPAIGADGLRWAGAWRGAGADPFVYWWASESGNAAPVQLPFKSGDGNFAFGPALVCLGRQFLMVWQENGTLNWSMLNADLVPSKPLYGWGKALTIALPASPQTHSTNAQPALAYDPVDDRAYLAWRDKKNGQVLWAKFDVADRLWRAPQPVGGAAPKGTESLAMCVVRDELIMTWTTGSPSLEGFTSSLPLRGAVEFGLDLAVWSAPRRMEWAEVTAGGSVGHVVEMFGSASIAPAPHGSLFAAWRSNAGLLHSTRFEGDWSKPARVTTNAKPFDCFRPAVARQPSSSPSERLFFQFTNSLLGSLTVPYPADLPKLAEVTPAACSWAADRLDVVAVDVRQRLQHTWWDGAWHDFEEIQVGNRRRGIAAIAISSDGAGRLTLVAAIEDRSNPANTVADLHAVRFDGYWSEPWTVGRGFRLSTPAIAKGAAGGLDIYASKQTATGVSIATGPLTLDQETAFSDLPWTQVGGGPAVVRISAGDVVVAYVDESGWLVERHAKSNSNVWTGPRKFVKTTLLGVTPALTQIAPGRLDLFIPSGSTNLYHIWAEGPNAPAEILTGPNTRGCAVTSMAAGRLDLLTIGAGGVLLHQWFEDAWGSWEQLPIAVPIGT